MNRYQYETSPRKLQPEYTPERKKYPKKSTARKDYNKNHNKKATKTKKEEAKNKVKVFGYVVLLFSILFTISYRNSLIDESFSQIKNLKSEISEIEKENEQLKVNIESKLNLNNLEKSARELLGMQKLDSDQVVYINVKKQDYIEPATEEIEYEEEKNWFEKLLDKIR